MKHHIALTVVLSTLLVWHNCLAAEDSHHKVDVCVYGGTASGVMAALPEKGHSSSPVVGSAGMTGNHLAAEKEGAKVILIEPSRWLGGMTGGGINHLDWGKGSTVGGSTYKILMEGLKEQNKSIIKGMPYGVSATKRIASASRKRLRNEASP